MQPCLGSVQCITGVADEDIGPETLRRTTHSGVEQARGRVNERRPVVGRVVGEEYLFRLYREQEIDVPIPQASRFEAAGELDPPHALVLQHGEDGADVVFRTREEIIIEDIATFSDGQFPE